MLTYMFQIHDGNCLVYDPVLTKQEQEVLHEQKIALIPHNEVSDRDIKQFA